jgi:hypothetical protein
LYPIERVKHKNIFRRCVHLNGEYRPVSDVKEELIQEIILNIIETFDLTKSEANDIVKKK